jgi:methyl-accepting chemotaxis protein
VRKTTETVSELGHTATKAALTAETVIGVANASQKCSDEGLHAVEVSTAELVSLADEVRVLSETIEGLNRRFRDLFDIASVVAYVADRWRKLADAAASATEGVAGDTGLRPVIAEIGRASDEAREAAAHVKSILDDVDRAMAAARASAENGARRAKHGAEVAATTGETIRRLASALKESSQAARAIATVAQEQDRAIDQVLQAMNEIYRATEDTMTSTDQVALEARVLNELATGLRMAIPAESAFRRLDGEGR